jgi:PTS system mannitol-specific IIC component
MSQSIAADQVKTIIFACEAGMGSSLMSVNMLKKKLKAVQISAIEVIHLPAREIPKEAQIVVVHQGLADLVRSTAPHAVVLTFRLFMNDPVFDQLVRALVENEVITSTC